jgi:quercetin dioxygenase-like cupin family protein
MAKSKSRTPAAAVLPEYVVGELLMALAPVSMPRKREAKVKEAILKKVAAAGKSGISTVRANDGRWLPWLPGIDAQVLYDDGARMSWLARFAPGARMAAHDHEGDEESTVLSGACYVGTLLLAQGDFQLAPHGSRHDEIFSPEGCVLLMRTPSLTPAQIEARTAQLRV